MNRISVSNVIGELVKNSIDAQSNVIHVEFNGSLDIRIIDDGCGFDENILQDIGVRQLFLSQVLQKNRFQYGRLGQSLFKIAQSTAEIFIESIKHNSDVRLYKTINANKSVYKVYETARNYKDASVTTAQGSMIVLKTLNLNIGDGVSLKPSIVNSVVELALVNFGIDFSVKDTATQQTLYQSYRTGSLSDKFEQYLESHQFFSKIHSVSCEKHDVKVELFSCEDGTSSKAFQFVYFNKLSEPNGKWKKFINKLCKKRFENDLNSTCPVYLLNISVANYSENQLTYNVIIDNCIRKCVEQLSKPPNKKISSTQPLVSKATESNHESATCSKAPEETNGNEDKGVRLGDWIFNNSSENYINLYQGRDVYRKKICENWVISLEKPKPKEGNDSLLSAAIEKRKTQPDDHLFKKPKPKTRNPKRKNQKIISKDNSKIKPFSHVPTQVYKPSQNVKAFNDSSLIRISKRLISRSSAVDRKRKNSTKNRIKSRLEVNQPTIEQDRKKRNEKSFENLNLLPVEPMNRIDTIPNVSFKNLNEQNNVLNDEFMEALEQRSFFRSTRNTLDLMWQKQTTNFNMNFSSSFAIHTINDNDPFMGFLEPDAFENKSISNVFESNGSPAKSNDIPTRTPTQPEVSPKGSSIYSETSSIRYRNHHNDSIHTHFRQRTYRNFIGDNSLNSNRSRRSSSEVIKCDRPRSIQNSAHSGTAVTSLAKQNSGSDLLSDNIRQTGWPVTININFGHQSK